MMRAPAGVTAASVTERLSEAQITQSRAGEVGFMRSEEFEHPSERISQARFRKRWRCPMNDNYCLPATVRHGVLGVGYQLISFLAPPTHTIANPADSTCSG
jgi:hypothetical protein